MRKLLLVIAFAGVLAGCETLGDIQPHKETVLEATMRYPEIEALLRAKKSYQDLTPAAQLVYIREKQKFETARLLMSDKRFTPDQIMRMVLQQSSASEMREALADDKSISPAVKSNLISEIEQVRGKYSDISIPDDVQAMWVFAQNPSLLTDDGCVRLADSLSAKTFLRDFETYVVSAKKEGKSLIITAYSPRRGWDGAASDIRINGRKLKAMTPYTCNNGQINYGYAVRQ